MVMSAVAEKSPDFFRDQKYVNGVVHFPFSRRSRAVLATVLTAAHVHSTGALVRPAKMTSGTQGHPRKIASPRAVCCVFDFHYFGEV
jgi:hypothetical protein